MDDDDDVDAVARRRSGGGRVSNAVAPAAFVHDDEAGPRSGKPAVASTLALGAFLLVDVPPPAEFRSVFCDRWFQKRIKIRTLIAQGREEPVRQSRVHMEKFYRRSAVLTRRMKNVFFLRRGEKTANGDF